MTVTELNGWDYIGYLSIPSIGLELPVMSQWSYAGLKIAPGRYSGSTYADNMVVCAHNYAKHFSPIKWLTEGAQVYFTDMDGMRWTYEVSYVENLQPTQIEEMTEKTEESDEWDLTLFTCTTGGSARCAVRCVRTRLPGAHNGDRRIRCKKSPVHWHRGFFISGIQWAVPTFTGDYLL